MAPRPTCERPPSGLNSYWTHVWDHALKVMRDQGTWAWELKPLLDEYVFALKGAEDARVGFGWLDHLKESVASEDVDWLVLRQVAGALPTQWDRHTKRAAALADALVLTPAAKEAPWPGIDEDQGPRSAIDELARRRAG
jgi:hypothetical protein